MFNWFKKKDKHAEEIERLKVLVNIALMKINRFEAKYEEVLNNIKEQKKGTS